MRNLLLFLLVTIVTTANAQLTAVVSPGYQFAPGEVPSTATLNQLGQPSIAISGTVTGTVGLGAKTVDGNNLKDSVVDNITTDYNASSPRAIEIKSGGVMSNQLSAACAGSGLSGGSGSALYVNVDNVNIGTNAGKLIMLAEQSHDFTSLSQPSSGSLNGLGAHSNYRWVWVCTTAENGYSINDEVSVSSAWASGNGSTTGNPLVYAPVMVGSSGNSMFYSIPTVGTSTGMIMNGKTGPPSGNMNLANWKLRVYYR